MLYDKCHLPFRGVARNIYRRLRDNPKRLYRNFKSINSTKPLRCNPISQTELHTLTCHTHLFMYITAIKSLLRFCCDVAVVVHDDGTLTTRDIATIEHHIVGIRVIRRPDADKVMEEFLPPFPNTRSYRDKIINSLELTDHPLLASTKKIIITNSDVLFLGRPDDVIQWIATDDDTVLCVYEEEPHQQARFLARINSPFPPHLTLALLCFNKSLVDLTTIEDLLSRVRPEDELWSVGQNLLPALIGKNVNGGKVRFLDRKLYQASAVFRDDAIFRHYWTSTFSLREQYFVDAAKVISELK